MLVGTFHPRLDDKGRLALPAKFRDEFADGLVVTRGQDGCLVVYSADEFRALLAPINDAPATVARVRKYQRFLYAWAQEETPDRQGRVTLSTRLREYAGIDRDVVVVGTGNRLEVWDPVSYEDAMAESDEEFRDFDGEIVPRS
jgi:MraZ protein